MHEPVALDERRRISSEQLAERVVEGVRREPGIQDRECCAETAFKNGIAVVRVAAFGCRLADRSEEHTSELQSPCNLVCRLLLEKKKSATTPKARYISLATPAHMASSPHTRSKLHASTGR